MAWIRTVGEEEADGPLKEVYGRIAGASGRVAHILKVESLAPGVLAAHWALYREVMYGRSPLRRAQRELIAVAVSQINGCHY